MPFRSKAQMAKFFADPKLRSRARRWAHETGMGGGTKKSKAAYRRLPERVKPRRKRKRRAA